MLRVSPRCHQGRIRHFWCRTSSNSRSKRGQKRKRPGMIRLAERRFTATGYTVSQLAADSNQPTPHKQKVTTASHSSVSSARRIQSKPLAHLLFANFNTLLPSTLRSPKWSPSFRFPHQNTVCVSLLPPSVYSVIWQDKYEHTTDTDSLSTAHECVMFVYTHGIGGSQTVESRVDICHYYTNVGSTILQIFKFTVLNFIFCNILYSTL